MVPETSKPTRNQANAKIWTGFLVAWLVMAACSVFVLPSIYRFDLLGPDVALFLLFFLFLMLLGTVVASWFWYAVPLPMATAKLLALWLTIPALAAALFHPEFGVEALMIWVRPWNNNQLLTLFLLFTAFLISRLGPWFSRRFFYPDLD